MKKIRQNRKNFSPKLCLQGQPFHLIKAIVGRHDRMIFHANFMKLA
jgi:hypothetical protein